VKKERAELVEKNHPKLSVRTQCKLLEVPRSSLDYRPVGESEEDRELMRLMDEIYLIDPCIGTRRLVKVLERDHGRKVNRKRLRRLRREMGLETIWCRPRNTSAPDKWHRKYPYLLGSMEVKRPDQAWCADITHVPMSRGHAYLCVVMDWYSRSEPGWLWSNTGGPVPGGPCDGGAANRPSAGGLQNRPRQPIHQPGMDRGTHPAGNRHQHGWKGPLDGQRVHRAALAQREARGHLPEGRHELASVVGGTGGVV
jgi:putative transposase